MALAERSRHAEIEAETEAPSPGYPDLIDLRFRALLPERDWTSLPPAVRRRFSKRLTHGESAVYVGRVAEHRTSLAGWLLTQAARLVGGPLPLAQDCNAASVVTVTEDPRGGQVWTRLYVRPSGFPQVIHSAKRFRGPTGLEEHVGAGIGMSLSVTVEDGALVFRSERYFLDLPWLRLHLPSWLAPGQLTVTHAETQAEGFSFTLAIDHPWFGTLISQVAEFHDSAPAGSREGGR